jgi:hypothetical protein
MATLLPKSELMIVELYSPTGTVKSLKQRQVVSKFPIRTKPKNEQFLTSSGLKELDTNNFDQSSLEFPLRTKISISNAVSERYFIPLLFWFNRDVGLALPNAVLPGGQTFIDIKIAETLSKIFNRNISKENGDFTKSLGRTDLFLIRRGSKYSVIRKK